MVHKKVFDSIGLFDEALPACEDYDFWLRAAAFFPVQFIDERLIIKRAGDWPQLSRQLGLDKYRIMALDKILKAGKLSEHQKRSTLKMLVYKCEIYGQGCKKHGRTKEALWAEKIKSIYG